MASRDDLGVPALGVAGPPINGTLDAGSFTRVHGFGWTKFEIDESTRELTVTTFTIEPYDAGGVVQANDREPKVGHRFRVPAS